MSVSNLPDLTIQSLFGQDGKIVLVTGGGTGLGLSMATAFAVNGAKVYIASRKMKNLEKAANDLNAMRDGCCIPITADLTTKEGCLKLAEKLKELEPNGLDVLINNSGVSWGSTLEDVDEKKGWDRVFDVNVKSLFYLTTSLVPLLGKKAQGPLHPTSVINITSIYASYPNAYMPTADQGQGAWSYLASKAAAAHLTRVLSVKLKKMNINVNAIAPGFYPSNMTASGLKSSSSSSSSSLPTDLLSRSHPSGHMGYPKDIAGPALLLASPAGAHLSGITITTDGGFTQAGIGGLDEDVKERFSTPQKGGEQRAKL